MNSLKKTYAFLLTTTMGAGLGFNLHSVAMDTYVNTFENFDRAQDTMSAREIINNCDNFIDEQFYILPLADEPSKCMVVNEDLTKCVYVAPETKIAMSGESPIGYGHENDLERKKWLRSLGYTTMDEAIREAREHKGELYILRTANVFEINDLNSPYPLFPKVTGKIKKLAEKTGIAGYKIKQCFCPIF